MTEGATALQGLPSRVEVRIEVPRYGLVKRRPDGSIDFLSPLPCPYNYGSVIGTRADDGDPLDAVVLGARLPAGTRRCVPLRGVIGFLDAGVSDPKLVCSDRVITGPERRALIRFFRLYATLKGVLSLARGARGPTRCLGWQALAIGARDVPQNGPGSTI